MTVKKENLLHAKIEHRTEIEAHHLSALLLKCYVFGQLLSLSLL